jgi:hypothetical protein
MFAVSSSFVSFASSLPQRRPHYTSFEVSQVPPVTGDGGVGGNEERSNLRLSQQIALNLQDQPRQSRPTSHGMSPR